MQQQNHFGFRGDEMADLVPSENLIIENGIGIADNHQVAAEFIKIGDGITRNMINQGFLKPEYHVLDVGSGLGRLARPLTSFLTGSYTGLDIVKSSVDWCEKAYSEIPNFSFHHADLFSTTYNPNATTSAKDYKFPFQAERFNFLCQRRYSRIC